MELALLSSMKLKDVVYAIGFDTLGATFECISISKLQKQNSAV
jgi:hypothetical protein